jgi:hypothetical protein
LKTIELKYCVQFYYDSIVNSSQFINYQNHTK